MAYEEKLPITYLEKFLEPTFVFFRDKKETGESFGDFCHRVGFEELRSFAASYKTLAKKSAAKKTKRRRVRQNEHRISVYEHLYQKLKATSQEQKKPYESNSSRCSRSLFC